MPGTISITSTDVYFDADEDDPLFKQQDPKVSLHHLSQMANCCACAGSARLQIAFTSGKRLLCDSVLDTASICNEEPRGASVM